MKSVLITGVMLGCLTTGLLAQEAGNSVLFVKEILIEGNKTTKNHVILREMSLKVGERVTPEAVEHDRKRIYSLQLFNKVELDYKADGDQATVYVRVSERWYLFPFPVFGFKYRDTKKFFYGAGVIHQNFRGRNEKVFGSFALGFDRWINLAYQNPKLTDDEDIFFRSMVSYSKVQNQNVSQGLYDQTVLIGNISIGKRFGLYQTLLGSVGYEDWKVSDAQEGRTASQGGRDKFLFIAGRYDIDTRDVREYSTAGYLVFLTATKFGIGESPVDLFRYGFDTRGFTKLGGGIVLGGRMFGSFVSGGVVPSYLHTYFGYNERLRGYFKTVLEGENITGSSVELRIPIFHPRYLTVATFLPPEFSVWQYGLYAGIFADAGKMWYRTVPFGASPWYSGFGAGLHFLLPYSIIVRTEYALNNTGRGEFVLDFGASF